MSERGRARDVYIAIMVAASSGRGLHLSWDECADLAMDDAIATRAANALTESEFKTSPLHYLGDRWKAINPYRPTNAEGYGGASKDDKGRPS